MKRIKVIYEDGDVLVIDKPAGYLSHGDAKSTWPDVSGWFLKKYPAVKGVGDEGREGIVHRLDKDTSGLMILAKNHNSRQFFKEQFENHTIQKTYLAITHGLVKEDQGQIDRPIGRSTHDARLRRTGSDADGKQRDALTYYKVLERFNPGGPRHRVSGAKTLGVEEPGLQSVIESRHRMSGSPTSGVLGFTYLEVHPKSGRTHQVRVHLKSIGKPILCDALYASGRECIKEMGRQALHASSLRLTLPSGEAKSFEAPLPADFQKTLEKLRKMC